nr:hypothetical protein [Tanacetum cinerariifolium]
MDVLEVTLPPQKRLCMALGLRFEVDESSSAPTARPTGGFRVDYGFVGNLDDEIRRDLKKGVGYGITDTWDQIVEDMQRTPATNDVAGLSQRMTDFVMTIRQDTDEIYGRLDDVQYDRLLMNGQLNMLRRDRRAHARTARLMESEARVFREACVSTADEDYRIADNKPLSTDTTSRGIDSAKDTTDTYGSIKMAPKRTTMSTPATTTTTTTPANMKKKMTDKYCPGGEIKKLEVELWNLKVK